MHIWSFSYSVAIWGRWVRPVSLAFLFFLQGDSWDKQFLRPGFETRGLFGSQAWELWWKNGELIAGRGENQRRCYAGVRQLLWATESVPLGPVGHRVKDASAASQLVRTRGLCLQPHSLCLWSAWSRGRGRKPTGRVIGTYTRISSEGRGWP